MIRVHVFSVVIVIHDAIIIIVVVVVIVPHMLKVRYIVP